MSTRVNGVPVRRWGSESIHLVPEPSTYPATAFGVEFSAVHTPVEAVCGVVMRGSAVLMNDDAKTRGKVCRRCKRVEARP